MNKFRIALFIIVFLSFSCVKEKKVVSKPSTLTFKEFGGDFTLQAKDGEWKLSSTDGKVRIIYFGFTFCPDICPMSLTKLSRVLKKLSSDVRKKILPVFVSVDYKRDNPETVSEYVKYFAPDFVGLSGSKSEIEKVTKQYGAFFKFVKLEDSALKYTVDHVSRFYVIGKNGEFYKTYANIEDDPDFLQDLKKIAGVKK